MKKPISVKKTATSLPVKKSQSKVPAKQNAVAKGTGVHSLKATLAVAQEATQHAKDGMENLLAAKKAISVLEQKIRDIKADEEKQEPIHHAYSDTLLGLVTDYPFLRSVMTLQEGAGLEDQKAVTRVPLKAPPAIKATAKARAPAPPKKGSEKKKKMAAKQKAIGGFTNILGRKKPPVVAEPTTPAPEAPEEANGMAISAEPSQGDLNKEVDVSELVRLASSQAGAHEDEPTIREGGHQNSGLSASARIQSEESSSVASSSSSSEQFFSDPALKREVLPILSELKSDAHPRLFVQPDALYAMKFIKSVERNRLWHSLDQLSPAAIAFLLQDERCAPRGSIAKATSDVGEELEEKNAKGVFCGLCSG